MVTRGSEVFGVEPAFVAKKEAPSGPVYQAMLRIEMVWLDALVSPS